MIEINFVLVLRIIFIIFFLIYFYRIFRDFTMFSNLTSGVIAFGLTALLELWLGVFGYLAKILSNVYFLTGFGIVILILVYTIVLLVIYFALSRIGWRFRKQVRKAKEAKRHAKRKAGEKALEKFGEAVTKK